MLNELNAVISCNGVRRICDPDSETYTTPKVVDKNYKEALNRTKGPFFGYCKKYLKFVDY